MIRACQIAGLALLAALAALSFVTPRAYAGTYAVHACLSAGDTRNASWYGIGDSPGTAVYAVCPAGDFHPYDTGLGARTTGGPTSRVGLNGGSWAEFDAPPDTSLHSMNFSGALGGQPEGGCWEAGISAWTGDFYSAPLLWGVQPCYLITGGWLPYGIGLAGYTHVRIGVRCATASGCQADWNGGHGVWANLRDVTVVVEDDVPPSITPVYGTLLAPGWHRGAGDAWADYADSTGIRTIALQIDGATLQVQNFDDPRWAAAGVQCDNARTVPCHNLSSGGLGFDTRTVSDGPHVLRLAGADAAGNWAVADRQLLVDNHAPDPPRAVAVSGGEGWHRANGFDVAWTNPGQGSASPIAEARFRMCRATAPSDCRDGRQSGSGISALHGLAVPDQGDWTLRVWLADAAGNVDATQVSGPVHLRLDPRVDAASFEAADRGDPRGLAVLVIDHASGVAGGTIQLRRQGTASWRGLPTVLTGGRLRATVPDTELADGIYELRALVRDVAGNERVADRYAEGSRALVVLPLRDATRLVGEAREAARRVCRTVPRGRVRRRVCRRTVARSRLGGSLTVPFGRTATIRGALQTFAGRPIAGASMEVSAEPRTGGGARHVAVLRTGGDGAFAYTAPAGPSGTLRVAYAGDEVRKPARADVALRVPAAATLRSSRPRVRNGQSIVFSGRLRGRPFPATGKLVVLQAFYRRAWRTFAITRSDARGRFRRPYRFQATVGRVAYRFRARLEREAAYPYEAGVSPVVTVVVRG